MLKNFNDAIQLSNKLIGFIMISLTLLMLTLSLYTYLFDICFAFYTQYEMKIYCQIMIVVGISIFFCLLFNFILVVLTNPGSSEQNQFYVNPIKMNNKFCNICMKLKPKRSQHCEICGYCILKQDHHCAWISNCVGHFNHRYFLLYIFYLWIYQGLILFSVFLVKEIPNTKQFQLTHFTSISFFPLTILNAWSWYLALKGYTTTEYLNSSINFDDKYQEVFQCNQAMQNIKIIFGTQNWLEILLPNVRILETDGMNWDSIHSLDDDHLLIN